MTQATDVRKPPTEKQMRRLLASSQPEDVHTLRAWLEDPPPQAPESVVSLLVYITKDGRSGWPRLRYGLMRAGRNGVLALVVCFNLYYWFVLMTDSLGPLWMAIVGGLIALACVVFAAVESVRHVRSLTRATNRGLMLLVERGDGRAVGMLARRWMPKPLTPSEAAFNADVARHLTRLINQQGGEPFDHGTEIALRRIVNRVFPTGTLARAASRLASRRDLNETDTDLLLSIIRHLSSVMTTAVIPVEAQASANVLSRVASDRAVTPNQSLLRDTSQTLLQAGRGTQSL